MSFFQAIRRKSSADVQKIIFLLFSLISVAVSFSLLFIPFCTYYATQADLAANIQTPLTPISVFSLLESTEMIRNGVAYLGFILFVLLCAVVTALIVWLLQLFLHLGGDAANVFRRAKRICISSTVATGLYFFGGVIFNFINLALKGHSGISQNALPFFILLGFDVLFAVYSGILHEEVSEQAITAQANVCERRTLKRMRWELFIYVACIACCAMLCLFSEIVTVTFEDVSLVEGDVSLSSLDFSLSGLDILQNYETMESGIQLLAFILLLLFSTVIIFFIAALMTLLSKSRTYFPLALGAVMSSIISCFVIGMYGKYYQIVQEANFETILSFIETAGVSLPEDMTLSSLKDFLTDHYTVESQSFLFFLLAMVVFVVLLIRRPYSKGMLLEHRLHLPSGEIAISSSNAAVEKAALPHSQVVPAQDSPLALQSAGNAAPAPLPLAENMDPCPAFSEIDELTANAARETEQKMRSAFASPTLPRLVKFVVEYARNCDKHLFYTEADIAAFIAGLGCSKLTILQGMSGTGKTSLPKIFCEALMSTCHIVEVESSWRDKNELLGYYNEFSKMYTPKKFTQALYQARLHPETLTFIVLDEMNLSRVEYYFSDFLSLMENEPDKREIKLLNVSLYKTSQQARSPYLGLSNGHTIKIPPNVWFVGTANRDESTFEISDKVYDRAHTMNFNKRAKKSAYFSEPIPACFLPADTFNTLLEEAKTAFPFDIDQYPLIAEVEKLLAPYHISFGNRIALQIEHFVSVYCACFARQDDILLEAVERILLSKVVSKLELKSIEGKAELAEAFKKLGLYRCYEFIASLDED